MSLSVIGLAGLQNISDRTSVPKALAELAEAVQALTDVRAAYYVANPTALEALDDTNLTTGHKVFVVSVNGWFRLVKDATDTDDGSRVFTASGGGRWISEPVAHDLFAEILLADLQALANGVKTYTVTLPGDPTFGGQAFQLGAGGIYHEPYTDGGAATYTLRIGTDSDGEQFVADRDVTIASAFFPGNGTSASIITYGLGSTKFRMRLTSDTDLNQVTAGYAGFYSKYMA